MTIFLLVRRIIFKPFVVNKIFSDDYYVPPKSTVKLV